MASSILVLASSARLRELNKAEEKKSSVSA